MYFRDARASTTMKMMLKSNVIVKVNEDYSLRVLDIRNLKNDEKSVRVVHLVFGRFFFSIEQ